MSSTESDREGISGFLACAALVAACAGLAEAGLTLVSQPAATFSEALWLALAGWVGLGVVGGGVALVAAWPLRFVGLRPTPVVGAALGAVTVVAIVALSLFRGVGVKQWALLAGLAAVSLVAAARGVSPWLDDVALPHLAARLAGVWTALAAALSLVLARAWSGTESVPAFGLLLGCGALGLAAVFTGRGLVALVSMAGLAFGWLAAPMLDRGSPSDEPSVLLISIDTLRADRLGAYGADDAVTPRLDALAEQSVVFDRALSISPRTGPSHTTMLTGLYPHNHGAVSNGQHPRGDLRWLPRHLERLGYDTAGVVSGWPLREDASGLRAFFHSYEDDFSTRTWLPERASSLRIGALAQTFLGGRSQLARDAPATSARALRWLERRGRRPFFLWVHYYDPHVPYEPPEEIVAARGESLRPGYDPDIYSWSSADHDRLYASKEEQQYLRMLYDAEITSVDRAIGTLLDGMESLGHDASNTIIVLTADHGETLDDHEPMFGHNDLYHSSLHVPLFIRAPGVPPARRDERVLSTDLAPTLADLVGRARFETREGLSLLPLLSGEEPVDFDAQRPALASLVEDQEIYSVMEGDLKFIWSSRRWFYSRRLPGREELYDLGADPTERLDLSGELPDLLERLRPLALAQRSDEERRSLSPEDREKLEALGYL